MCQKLCIFIAFFTFKVVITPPTNPPNPFSAQQQWPCPIVQQYRLRHTPRSQQVRPNKQTAKKRKKGRAYYRETFFVLHLKMPGFIFMIILSLNFLNKGQ